MKKSFYLGMLPLLFAACTNEMDIQNPSDVIITKSFDSKITVQNGILNFPDYDSYHNTFKTLHMMNKDELLNWNKNLHYTSMLQSDANSINYVELKNDNNSLEEKDVNNESVLDPIRKALYSDKGLLCIQDTIYKVLGEYIYKVPVASESLLSDIEMNPEQFKDIRFKHTINMKSIPTSQGKNAIDDGYGEAIEQGKGEARSPLIYVQSNRREHVKFIAQIQVDNHWYFLKFGMVGRAQKKVF